MREWWGELKKKRVTSPGPCTPSSKWSNNLEDMDTVIPLLAIRVKTTPVKSTVLKTVHQLWIFATSIAQLDVTGVHLDWSSVVVTELE